MYMYMNGVQVTPRPERTLQHAAPRYKTNKTSRRRNRFSMQRRSQLAAPLAAIRFLVALSLAPASHAPVEPVCH